MKLSVVGLGHIGLPTAAMFARAGFEVAGYDSQAAVRRDILAESVADAQVRAIVRVALRNGRLRVVDSLESADAFIICVPTPTAERKPDLCYVAQSAKAIAPLLRDGDLVILESTVPPGTTERIIAGAIREAGRDPDTVRIVHAPERVIPGNIVCELRQNARIVGGRRSGDAQAAADLYASFVRGEIHLTDCRTAELVKVIENTYRDINIAYANELALLSEELDVDVWEAIRLANDHPRVNIMFPGPGVGGHCIPVDPHFLSNANPFVTELIQTSRRINERMPHVVVRRVAEYVQPGATIAVLGAAYKANVDDTRESPTEQVEELLHERGFTTRVFDPVADRYVRPLAATIEEAVTGADAVVLMVGHDAFKQLDPAALATLMRGRVLIDTRRFYDGDAWAEAGFQVYALGGRRRAARPIAAAS